MKRVVEVKIEGAPTRQPLTLSSSAIKLEATTVSDSAPKRLRVSQNSVIKSGIPVVYQLCDTAARGEARTLCNTRIILNSDQPIVEQILNHLKDWLRVRVGFAGPPSIYAIGANSSSFEIDPALKSTGLTAAVYSFWVRDFGTRSVEVLFNYAINESELVRSSKPVQILIPRWLSQEHLVHHFLEKMQRPLLHCEDIHCTAIVRVGVVTKTPSSEEKCDAVTQLEIEDLRRARSFLPVKTYVFCAVAGQFETWALVHPAFRGVDIAAQLLERPLQVTDAWIANFTMTLAEVPLGLESPVQGVTMKIGQGLVVRAPSHYPVWIHSSRGFHLLLFQQPMSGPATLAEFERRYWIVSTNQRPRLLTAQQDETNGPKAGELYIEVPPLAQPIHLYNGVYHATYWEDEPGAHKVNKSLYRPEKYPPTEADWIVSLDFTPGSALSLDTSNPTPPQWWQAESC